MLHSLRQPPLERLTAHKTRFNEKNARSHHQERAMNTERMGMPHVHQLSPSSGVSHTTAASRRRTSESWQMTFFIHGLWAPHTPHVRFAGLLWAEPPGGATYITLSDPGRCFKRPTRTTSPHISGRYLSVVTSAHQTSNPNSQLPSGSGTPSSRTAGHHPSWLDTSPMSSHNVHDTQFNLHS